MLLIHNKKVSSNKQTLEEPLKKTKYCVDLLKTYRRQLSFYIEDELFDLANKEISDALNIRNGCNVSKIERMIKRLSDIRDSLLESNHGLAGEINMIITHLREAISGGKIKEG